MGSAIADKTSTKHRGVAPDHLLRLALVEFGTTVFSILQSLDVETF
jgi:hypothetical protein